PCAIAAKYRQGARLRMAGFGAVLRIESEVTGTCAPIPIPVCRTCHEPHLSSRLQPHPGPDPGGPGNRPPACRYSSAARPLRPRSWALSRRSRGHPPRARSPFAGLAMNRIYRLVFNRTLGLIQVAPETARARAGTAAQAGRIGRRSAVGIAPLSLLALGLMMA